MIDVLPRQQLCSQYCECCCIAKNLATNGTPNHLLVNKILDYPIGHFVKYTYDICDEMSRRGYKISEKSLQNFQNNMIEYCGADTYAYGLEDIFPQWHTPRYLYQCLMNLSEKYDCGGVSEQEWNVILNKFGDGLSEWYKEKR